MTCIKYLRYLLYFNQWFWKLHRFVYILCMYFYIRPNWTDQIITETVAPIGISKFPRSISQKRNFKSGKHTISFERYFLNLCYTNVICKHIVNIL